MSTHSNPRILKVNRKSRYGRPLSPFDSDDDDEGVEFDDGEDEDEDEEDWSDEVSIFFFLCNFFLFRFRVCDACLHCPRVAFMVFAYGVHN